MEKTHRDPDDFQLFLAVLENRITTVSKAQFKDQIYRAEKITPDADDVASFALSLKLDAKLWSDDKELQEQDAVSVVATTDLFEGFE